MPWDHVGTGEVLKEPREQSHGPGRITAPGSCPVRRITLRGIWLESTLIIFLAAR